MKTSQKLQSVRKTLALTLIDLLVVIALIAILVSVLGLPHGGAKEKAKRVVCSSNLRQIGSGLQLWSGDHRDEWPWQISTNNNGTLESIETGGASQHFQVLSNYLPTLRTFLCMSDPVKTSATNYSTFTDANVSYFISLTSVTNTSSQALILSGDRHLQFNGHPAKPGLFIIPSAGEIEWTHELHSKLANSPGGSLLFLDGHAGWKSKNFSLTNFGTGRLIIP
jgi:type II secretory pathway pseudopilin PulG